MCSDLLDRRSISSSEGLFKVASVADLHIEHGELESTLIGMLQKRRQIGKLATSQIFQTNFWPGFVCQDRLPLKWLEFVVMKLAGSSSRMTTP